MKLTKENEELVNRVIGSAEFAAKCWIGFSIATIVVFILFVIGMML